MVQKESTHVKDLSLFNKAMHTEYLTHTGPTDFCFCFLIFLCMKPNIFQNILSSSYHPLPSPKPGIGALVKPHSRLLWGIACDCVSQVRTSTCLRS